MLVCPVLPKSRRASSDDFHRATLQFNGWGKLARDLGMRLAFHNHTYILLHSPAKVSHDRNTQE